MLMTLFALIACSEKPTDTAEDVEDTSSESDTEQSTDTGETSSGDTGPSEDTQDTDGSQDTDDTNDTTGNYLDPVDDETNMSNSVLSEQPLDGSIVNVAFSYQITILSSSDCNFSFT